MKAPDKIYVPIVDLGVEDGKCLSPIWWNRDKKDEHPGVIDTAEFIRKEALLEWAEEMKDALIKETDGRWSDVGRHDMLTLFIDKINSL